MMSNLKIDAQTIAGSWEGDLNVQGTTLKLIFHIVENEGAFTTTLDSPNQGAYGMEMDATSVENGEVVISQQKMGMESRLTYDPSADMLKGKFKQGPMNLPLELKRVSEKEVQEAAVSDHPLAGDWNGVLDVMGSQLRLVFHVTEAQGVFTSTMDSPDQGAFGMKVDTTVVNGNEIVWTNKRIGMKASGEYMPDSSFITVDFNQAGRSMPLKLGREEVARKEQKRPQEPTSMDYKQEEVKFTNPLGGHSLAGTLTIPKSGEFDKVVVLVSGSGPQDRNEELIGHKPFLVLSDYLTRNGVAVLRYDDRGVGGSTGDFQAGTSMDFADDATAAVNFLKAREDMSDKKFGVMGHSEGGLIAPIVAQKTDLDFIVLLAGPGIRSDELMLEQTVAILRAGNEDEDEIMFNKKSNMLIFDYMNEHQEVSVEELREGMAEIIRERFKLLPEEDVAKIDDIEVEIENQIKTVSTPWFRYFLNYDPSDYLTKVTIPTLAVNGSLDLQVLPNSNLSGIKKSLEKAGNKNYVIKEFEGLNHLFQMSETGAPSEYGAIEETFNEEALEFILDWVVNFDK
jgi:pimeloyl-ACP methyl ester carboxylesterase